MIDQGKIRKSENKIQCIYISHFWWTCPRAHGTWPGTYFMSPVQVVPKCCAAGAGVQDMCGTCAALSIGGHVAIYDKLTIDKEIQIQ